MHPPRMMRSEHRSQTESRTPPNADAAPSRRATGPSMASRKNASPSKAVASDRESAGCGPPAGRRFPQAAMAIAAHTLRTRPSRVKASGTNGNQGIDVWHSFGVCCPVLEQDCSCTVFSGSGVSPSTLHAESCSDSYAHIRLRDAKCRALDAPIDAEGKVSAHSSLEPWPDWIDKTLSADLWPRSSQFRG